MSGNGRADNGRGNNRKRHFRRRSSDREEGIDSSRRNGNTNGNNSYRTQQKPNDRKSRPRGPEDSQNRQNPGRSTDSRSDKALQADRPKWVPPKMSTEPLPSPDCLFCGKPIRDISQAMADKDTGSPVHFDCVVSRIAGLEMLDKDDSVTYIGGGRFGVVTFNGRTDFTIKKIIEWENKDKRADWRSEICDRYTIM